MYIIRGNTKVFIRFFHFLKSILQQEKNVRLMQTDVLTTQSVFESDIIKKV